MSINVSDSILQSTLVNPDLGEKEKSCPDQVFRVIDNSDFFRKNAKDTIFPD